MTKKIYTISKAAEIMSEEIDESIRSTWRQIFKKSLQLVGIDKVYIDPLFIWKKIDDNHVMEVYRGN